MEMRASILQEMPRHKVKEDTKHHITQLRVEIASVQ